VNHIGLINAEIHCSYISNRHTVRVLLAIGLANQLFSEAHALLSATTLLGLQ